VDAVKPTKPITYRLKDYQGNPIQGGFYQEELTSVKYPDVYLIEKVLKRRGNRLFVKWLGFDSSHNSWIEKLINKKRDVSYKSSIYLQILPHYPSLDRYDSITSIIFR